MLDEETLRGTALGTRVLTIFDEDELRRLARIVEGSKPGFKDEEARRRFPDEMRLWAFRWLHQLEGNPRRQSRTVDKSRVTPRSWERIKNQAAKLEREIKNLPRATVDELVVQLSDQGRSAADQVRLWPDGRNPVANLARTLARLAAAKPTFAGRGGKEKPCTPAVHDLGRLWAEFTGARPTVTWREDLGEYRGAFYDFVHDAVLAFWPSAGSLDGVIREVCTPVR
jgi:hypothetical protein